MTGTLTLSPLWSLPFLLMLGAIAVLPLLAPRFWEKNTRKALVAAVLALPVLLLYWRLDAGALLHSARDYVSFIVLLGGLYVVAGSLRLRGDLRATPFVNSAFLAAGAVLASFVGTTGAAMLLIRPLLETNAERRRVAHTVVFFILLVANAGGCLTPLGDPPLFLGYLAGVPFAWTFRLWPAWLLACAFLLAVHHGWDRRAYSREAPEDRARDNRARRPLRLEGGLSLLWLAGIVLSVAFLHAPWREAMIAALAAAAWIATPAERRAANRFTFQPLVEVSALFAGIFITMLPALDWLRASAPSLGLTTPRGFFWGTGIVSSVLDNAPTYLAFLAAGQGLHLPNEVAGVSHSVLAGISLGAVFMGANTYIGNGPNLMVKAIAEERGIAMPGFFAYVAIAVPVMLPVYLATAFWLLP